MRVSIVAKPLAGAGQNGQTGRGRGGGVCETGRRAKRRTVLSVGKSILLLICDQTMHPFGQHTPQTAADGNF